jgi:hypothetical protein
MLSKPLKLKVQDGVETTGAEKTICTLNFKD